MCLFLCDDLCMVGCISMLFLCWGGGGGGAIYRRCPQAQWSRPPHVVAQLVARPLSRNPVYSVCFNVLAAVGCFIFHPEPVRTSHASRITSSGLAFISHLTCFSFVSPQGRPGHQEDLK